MKFLLLFLSLDKQHILEHFYMKQQNQMDIRTHPSENLCSEQLIISTSRSSLNLTRYFISLWPLSSTDLRTVPIITGTQ